MTPSLVFTPPSLRGMAKAPAFLLGAVDGGSGPYLVASMASLGHVRPAIDQYREAMLAELGLLWPPAALAEAEATLRALWAKVDAGATLSTEEKAALDDATGRLAAKSERLRDLAHQEAEFSKKLPEVALATSLEAVAGLPDITFVRIAGLTAPPTLRQIEAALDAMERADGAEHPVAYFELKHEALIRIRQCAEGSDRRDGESP